jgi:hypothetical protein
MSSNFAFLFLIYNSSPKYETIKKFIKNKNAIF